MNYQQTIELTKHRSSMLRKMLSDTLYFDPRFGVETNSYQRLLTDLQYKLHQQVNRSRERNYNKPSHNVPRKLSKRQIEVIENAIDRYKRWLTKDKDDPDFISTRHKQMNLVDKLNAHHTKGQVEPDEFTESTQSISFYDSIIIFERGQIKWKQPLEFGDIDFRDQGEEMLTIKT